MANQQAAIEISGLTKQYAAVRAVDELSLTVPKGSIFGFLGPNGAGKTTTIKLLLDLIRPTSGTMRILGKDSQKEGVQIRRSIGYLSGDMVIDGDLTGIQYLEYIAHVQGVSNYSKRDELTKRLKADVSKKIKNLSRGNKQKLGLIAALSHEPELLIFDEPTSGLDPLMQAEFNALMAEHNSRGGTVFMSSHVLSEVQEICDHVAFIQDGKVLAQHSMAELGQLSVRQVWVTTPEANNIAKALKNIKGISELRSDSRQVHCHYSGDINTLMKVLVRFKVSDLRITEADLDTLFMQYYLRAGANG